MLSPGQSQSRRRTLWGPGKRLRDADIALTGGRRSHIDKRSKRSGTLKRTWRALNETPVIRVEDLYLSFGGIQALSGVTTRLMEGEIFAIIGPNGAGKTCLLNCISRFYTPQEGRDPLQGPRHHPAADPLDRQARHRPHLSEHRAVQGHDRPGQHQAGPARLSQVGHLLRHALLRPDPARGTHPAPGNRRNRSSICWRSSRSGRRSWAPCRTGFRNGSSWPGRWP